MAFTPSPEPAVGLVGLGSLGSTIFAGLASAGRPVAACHDADPLAAASRASGGDLPFVGSPRAVADACEVVFVSVFDEDQVRDVALGEHGLARSDRRPLCVVVTSTVSQEFVRSLADELAADGVDLVDCGINGAPGIDDGKTVASVGGPDHAVDAIVPILELIADPVVHMGAVGNGMTAKLVRNMIVYSTWYVGWLGGALGAAAELDMEKLLQVVDASERWAFGATFLLHRALEGDTSAAAGANPLSALAHKDLAAVLALAESAGLQLPLVDQIDADYARTGTVPPGDLLDRR